MQSHPTSSQNQKVSFGSLLSGIAADVKNLFTQELTLAKLEVREELQQTKAATISFGIGFSIVAMGSGLLLLMLVHLLHTFTTLPLWACYGIFGGICLLTGGIFLKIGSTTAEQIDLIPDETLETLQENADWLTGKTPNSEDATRRTQ